MVLSLLILLTVNKTHDQVLDKVIGELNSVLKKPDKDRCDPIEHLCTNIHSSLSYIVKQ